MAKQHENRLAATTTTTHKAFSDIRKYLQIIRRVRKMVLTQLCSRLRAAPPPPSQSHAVAASRQHNTHAINKSHICSDKYVCVCVVRQNWDEKSNANTSYTVRRRAAPCRFIYARTISNCVTGNFISILFYCFFFFVVLRLSERVCGVSGRRRNVTAFHMCSILKLPVLIRADPLVGARHGTVPNRNIFKIF